MKSLLLILGLVILAATGAAVAGDDWSVYLDDGKQLDGALVRIEPGRYILQTSDGLFELTDDDLDERTFDDRPRSDAVPKRRIVETRHYDELHRDGMSTSHWKQLLHNDSDRALTSYRFGLAPWEQQVIDRRTLRDDFGNELGLHFDPPRHEWQAGWDQRVQVTAPLPVPVAPGESWTITGSSTRPAAVSQVADGYRYRYAGNYSEDRLVWLKVRLPQGATVVRTSPQPSARFAQNGFEYVMWRQYYKKGQERLLEVVYTFE